ncbi:MAG TPA: type II toxin-antitoxin system HipA family toxin [Steroidobacteraceae bacterium]|nr:type II toxin-antitoxin system HipA family toxin [Steroidobacteraceae bacterium]
MASLIVWMNGDRVGEWGTLRGGRTPFFRYEESWADSPHGRALSLSLPLTADREVRGHAVEYYFDNLLPDSAQIRSRLRTRFKTRSPDAFDLLTAIGRDCVGAVQLLPPKDEPVGWDRVDATPLTEGEVEQTLRDVTLATPLGHPEQEDFRISLAGAQEKTALLAMAGHWFRPRHATPTTHILKLPLGIIGGFRGDFSDSVENEWLCAQLLRELELPVADAAIARFGEQRALVVRRFDRRWVGADAADVVKKRFKPEKGMWIARLPQEDLCQAMGLPHTLRYEADGGPSIQESLTLLANSEQPVRDQANFVLAQLAFWLLAATDGHGKNFSLYHLTGGAYGLTPFYDVISAWPIIGHGKNQLPVEKARLAMSLRGRRAHYRLHEITAGHWQELAARTLVPGLWTRMQSFVESALPGLERVEKRLPRAFPERVYTSIRDGVHGQVRRFAPATARE